MIASRGEDCDKPEALVGSHNDYNFRQQFLRYRFDKDHVESWAWIRIEDFIVLVPRSRFGNWAPLLLGLGVLPISLHPNLLNLPFTLVLLNGTRMTRSPISPHIA